MKGASPALGLVLLAALAGLSTGGGPGELKRKDIDLKQLAKVGARPIWREGAVCSRIGVPLVGANDECTARLGILTMLVLVMVYSLKSISIAVHPIE